MVQKIAAKRYRRNRPAGSLETKTYSATKETDKEVLIASVTLKILEKSPCPYSQKTFLQQEIATAHRILEDPNTMDVCYSGRMEITLLNQPASSPDINFSDVQFSNAIQSLQMELRHPLLTSSSMLPTMHLTNQNPILLIMFGLHFNLVWNRL